MRSAQELPAENSDDLDALLAVFRAQAGHCYSFDIGDVILPMTLAIMRRKRAPPDI